MNNLSTLSHESRNDKFRLDPKYTFNNLTRQHSSRIVYHPPWYTRLLLVYLPPLWNTHPPRYTCPPSSIPAPWYTHLVYLPPWYTHPPPSITPSVILASLSGHTHPQKGHGSRHALPLGRDMGPGMDPPPHPLDRMTRQWKHYYLPTTSLVGGKNVDIDSMVVPGCGEFISIRPLARGWWILGLG